MSIDIQMIAIVSVLTGLVTETIKKFCQATEKPYISNIIAACVSVFLSFFIIVLKPVLVDLTPVTGQMIFSAIVTAFFSVLSACLSFDKVKQTIDFIKG